MHGTSGGEFSLMWRLPIDGVEVLHARFVHHKFPRHSHESATIALMEAGAAGFRYRGEDHVAGPGDVFLLNPDEVHTGQPISPGGYVYRVLYLHPAALSALLPAEWDASSSALSFSETVLRESRVVGTLRQLHRAVTAHESPMLAEALLLRLSQVLLHRYHGSSFTGTKDPGRGRAVRLAREYLEAHIANKVMLRDVASAARTSPYRLVRMFSAEVGMPPHAYQTQLRVRLARQLLAEGVPATEVAAQSGFYDQAHLSKVFKSYTGVSPAHFSQGIRAAAWPGAEG